MALLLLHKGASSPLRAHRRVSLATFTLVGSVRHRAGEELLDATHFIDGRLRVAKPDPLKKASTSTVSRGSGRVYGWSRGQGLMPADAGSLAQPKQEQHEGYEDTAHASSDERWYERVHRSFPLACCTRSGLGSLPAEDCSRLLASDYGDRSSPPI